MCFLDIIEAANAGEGGAEPVMGEQQQVFAVSVQ